MEKKMNNLDHDQDNQKPNKGTSKSSKEYLPDYVKARSKHHKPPHLGTFDVGMSVPQWRPDHVPDTRIDKFTFFMVLVILFSIAIPLILFPEQGKRGTGQPHRPTLPLLPLPAPGPRHDPSRLQVSSSE